ncbi:TPA: hypothetical protein QB278_002103 [Pasteurella multocida]|nr:hypothetical protein [Pasteurella multocida]
MALNISKLEITQERMEKLLKLEEVIETLKEEEQPLSIRDFLSVIYVILSENDVAHEIYVKKEIDNKIGTNYIVYPVYIS